MNKYLDGYLKSIPASEQLKINSYIDNILKTKVGTNDFYDILSSNPEYIEFSNILDKIKNNSVATRVVDIQDTDKSYDTHNEFFKNVYVDLLYLYQIIEALYAVKENYHALISSYTSDLNNEVKRLSDKLHELKTRETIQNGHIVINETFLNNESFFGVGESSINTMSNLFIDRDNTSCEVCNINVYNDDSYIGLLETNKVDLLHNEAGKTMAHIELLDYRGVLSTSFNTIENAIDMSNFTYWDCSTTSSSDIKINMDEYEEGGAYVKFKISLPKIKPITEISLEPFCSKPVEICSIKINGVKGNDNVVKLHEVTKNYKTNITKSISTMVFGFDQINADYIEIVMRQKNYTLENQVKNQKYSLAEGLLRDALGERLDSHTESVDIHGAFEDYYEDYIYKWNKEYIKNI